MKKKFSSILLGVLLVFAGVFMSACGDKYKKLEFDISYAFSEDATNWYDANDGINLNYSVENDEYVFDVNGNTERVNKNDFNLYVKVTIKGVKEKHLGYVTVYEDSDNIAFTSANVKSGAVVKMGIVGAVNSQISFYENESGKSTKIDIAIDGKLTDIQTNQNIIPAIVVGGEINLYSLSNLILYNQNENAPTTNQTGVAYEFVEFGTFTEAGFKSATNNSTYKNFVTLNNGKLTIKDSFNGNDFGLSAENNVVKLKATSVHNENISTDVYVYIVENNLANPTVKFSSSNEDVNGEVAYNGKNWKGLDLYYNLDTSKDNTYASTSVVLENLNSVYNNTMRSANGDTITFKPVVYVGDNATPYDFDSSPESVHNLILERTNNTYTITLVNRSNETSVDIKFGYQLVCEGDNAIVTFTDSQPDISTSVEVRKHVLTSAIIINGTEYKEDTSINGTVYSTSNGNYKGYELNLGLDPIDVVALKEQTNTIKYTTGNLIVKDERLTTVADGDNLSNNTKLYIKFANGVNAEQTVSISTITTPPYFDGREANSNDTITITLTLKKSVTADDLEFVSATDYLTPIREVNVSANNNSSVFVKVYYSGILDKTTVKFSSSNYALNSNGDKQIDLTSAEFVGNGTGYDIYKLTIPATDSVTPADLTVYAGDLGKGAGAVVTLKPVNVMTNATSLKIVAKDSENVTTFGDNKFAIVKNKELDFNVYEVVNEENVSNTIKNLEIKSKTIEGDNAEYFGGTEVLNISATINTNSFTVQGWTTKTRVVGIVVNYYCIDGSTGAVKESSYTLDNVQFAVYNPIDNIVVSIKKDSNNKAMDEIVYVNSLLTESRETEITYTSYAKGNSTPTENIYFGTFVADDLTGLETKNNVTSVDISINESLNDYSQIKISYSSSLAGDVEDLTNNTSLKNNASISGLLKIRLTDTFSSKHDVRFVFTANRFGTKSSTIGNATIKFVQVDKATGINITKGDIVSYSSTNNELQLSFMEENKNIASFGASARFNSTSLENSKRFDNLTYALYKYTLNNGEPVYELDGKTPKLRDVTSLMSGISVEIKNGIVTVSADNNIDNVGGLYKLVIATMDSYVDTTGKFGTSYSINVRVSDGKDANSAYVISTAEQFKKINNNLSAFYVLGNVIDLGTLKDPIGYDSVGGNVAPFTGSLSGKLYTVTESGTSSEANYSIYVTVKNSKQKTDGGTNSQNLYGLFTMLEGTITDLNLHVGFSSEIETSGTSVIGGLVAINYGTIERVNVYSTGEFTINNETNFGGIVGVNNGLIHNCKLDTSNGLTITASVTSNIGLVVGTNAGTITGAYKGKESLNSINFDVVANLTVKNTVENVSYNIGGVAGKSTNDISNMLVGGQIIVTSINNAGNNINITGYLGGIVGQTTGDLSYVGALGLNLNNADKNGIQIAGIAGSASEIDNARFISASSTFTFGKMLGEIVGGDVAGISFNATVTNSTVESFISTVTQNGASSTFYTLSGNNVYGMINSGSLENSFVSANLQATGSLCLTSNETDANKNEKTYFIGQIKGTTITKNSTYSVVYLNKVGETGEDKFVSITGFDNIYSDTGFVNTIYEYTSLNQTLIEYLKSNNHLKLIENPTTDNFASYSKVYVKNESTYSKYNSGDAIDSNNEYYGLSSDLNVSELRVYYKNESTYIKLNSISIDLFNQQLYSQSLNTTNWDTAVNKEGFGLNSKINVISFATGDYAGIEWYFPYLTYNGNLLMIEQPTSLSAEINQDYKIENEKNVYVDNIEIKEEDVYNISESVVVDFFTNNYSNYTDVNTHYLVDTRCDNCKNGDTNNCTCSKCAENEKAECICHNSNGLLELKMLPVTSGLVFEIMGNGSDYATIINNEKICFVGASNGKPIIVKAYSVFNTDVKAYVAFYSQQTYSKLTLEGTNVSSSNTDYYDYEYRTYKGKTGGLLTLAGENIIGGTTFDSLFDKGTTKGYISVVASYENDKLDVKTETLSTISIKINDTHTITTNGESSTVTLKVYLKADYFGKDSAGTNNIKTDDILLGEVKVKVLMYNIADGITISGADSFEADSSSTITIQADLKTGFVNASDSTTNDVEEEVIKENGNIKIGSSENKDSIYFTLSAHGEEIERIKSATGVTYIVDLFNFDVYSIRTDSGYRYYINLSLQDEHDYRYLTENIKFELMIWAKSNTEIQNSVEITIKPTTVSTLRITNYAVNKIDVKTDTKSELTIGNVESSIIAPGGRGNIMVVYAEKSYANIEELEIESSTLYVPSLGRDVNLIFTQMVYNTNSKKFETLFNSSTTAQNGTTLALQKATTIDSTGKTAYTGQIYIHAQLVNFAGLEARITASLNVTSNGKEMSVSRDLSTNFLPGATLSYNGIELETNKYLVQDETFGNSAKIKLYGYEFNSNPIMNANWELTNGVDYFYDTDEGSLNEQVSQGADETDNDYKNRLNTYLTNGTLYYSLTENGVTTYHKATSQGDLGYANATYYSITNRKTIKIGNEKYNIDNYVNTYFVNNYNSVEYNSVDGSYTLEVKFNIAKDIPTNFSLSASLSLISKEGQVETAESDEIVFCPSKYVITDLALSNTSGNKKMLAINRTDKLEFIFTTLDTDYDYSSAIYEEIFINKGVTNVDNLASLFEYYDPTKKTFKDENSAFDIAVRNNYLNITGLSKFEKEVTLKMTIGYTCTNGKYEVVFGNNSTTLAQQFEYSFTLQIYPGAGEENATPIYYAYEMFDDNGNCLLSENAHYILMDDITLDLVNPIDFNIGSLDGNNHVIKIKNFVIDPSKTNYGLFATLGTYQDEEGNSYKSILKNVIVDYSEFNAENNGRIEFTNNNMTNIVFGGLVANNNGGLIYNSDVISSAGNKTITIITDDNSSLTFGGLVGINSGKITNSRVGRSSLTIIDAKNDLTTTKSLGSLTFVLGSDTNSGFSVTAGGFAGENSGDIASSYFANSNLINYSNEETTNLTAGFVGKNNSNASIQYSFVKAKEDSITSSSPCATGSKIEGKSNSIVAGFVYENAGDINDCYANIELKTKSTYMAGFVYTHTSGTISECYSACTMKTEDSSISDDAEQPFVGKNKKGEYLEKGTIKNAYYLIANADEETGSSSIQALNSTNFQDKNNLTGFVFVESNVKNEREQGVWSYTDLNNNSLILPELMNANTISHSAKYLIAGNGTTEKFTYTNADSYLEGTKNNPYIIRSVSEYNDILTGNRADMSTETSKSGYIRFIDDIDFSSDNTAIKTRVKYTLGDNNKSIITSIEGNGMSISGIYFDVSEPGITEIGLFANIKNAFVKNLTLNFATPTGGQYSTTLVSYSGGLAGKITDSAIINITLNGTGVSLSGQNYVGGLAGMVKGQSLLYGIESNLSAEANSKENGMYYSQDDYLALGIGSNLDAYNNTITSLSYAGGLAGVIDLDKRSGIEYNVAYINIRGDKMNTRTNPAGEQLANISGEYAGGVAGFVSRKVNAFKVKYFIGSNEIISGDVASAGMFAVSLGSVTASQVTAEETTQRSYDEVFGNYVINIGTISLDKEKIGNTNLIQSNNYAGGLIGIGLNAKISSSYSRASIKSGEVVGGLIGVSVGSNVTYSYALPYVNINSSMKYVGGLIGQSYMVSRGVTLPKNANIKSYEKLVSYYLTKENSTENSYTDLQFTFSSILMDKAEFIAVDKQETKPVINYISPSFENNNNTINITSGNGTAFTDVFAGTVDYSYADDNGNTQGELGSISGKAEDRGLKFLYDLTSASNEVVFSDIFKAWDVIPYWTIKNTNYFALLTSEDADNYIEIRNPEDFKMIASNPNGKYMIVEDIDLGTIESNWVVGTTFTGVLTGKIDSDKELRRKIEVSLRPTQSNTSTGFFNTTSGAEISNIDIVWVDGGQGAIDTSKVNTFTSIAGLSCLDGPDEDGECSTFENVRVRVNNDGYLVKPVNDTDNSKVQAQTFAGLIASTESSLINSCNFIGKAKVTLTAENEDVYFGGLVGVAGKDNRFDDSSMTIMSSTLGSDGTVSGYPATEFDITVGDCKGAYIGGAVAKITETAVSSIDVGTTGYRVAMNVTINNDKTNNIAGLVGFESESIITTSNVNADISISSTTDNSTVIVGGLVAQASQNDANNKDKGIKSSNANANINLAELKASTLYASSGVAWLNGSNIEQCLFTGEIVGEKDNEGLEITNIYAGGAVAFVGSDSNISETMSNANITVGSSVENCNIYAGGFVGSVGNAKNTANLTLSNVVSTGKLVPISGGTAGTIHISAMVGSVNGTINIENSYTLTSVIADAISGASLQNTSSDVLVGYANTDISPDKISNTYFSTDISLTTNDKNLGTNLNAIALTGSKVFDTETISGWKEISSKNETRLPYLLNLEDSLKVYGILVIDDNSKTYDYVSGTVLRPIVTDGTIEFSKTKFAYYIVENGFSVNTSNQTLNGVLIGHDVEITSSGLINEIAKHSAVSNLHVKLDTEVTNGYIIANTNNGLMFNCSVQGEQLNTGSTDGLIANTNNGTIAYCYSSAEVTIANSSGLAGIAGTNNGVINSCYFTGYIKDGNSAGITLKNGESNYIYNTYMAGVIAGGTFSNIRTSFSATTFTGSNNFVDMYANIESKGGVVNTTTKCIEGGEIATGLTATETSSLMATTDFKGAWHATVESGTIKTDATGFGYNYGYPIYNFNKYALKGDSTDLELTDIKFSLDTGKGDHKGYTKEIDGKNVLDLDGQYTAILNNTNNDYNTAYKIPHLGVLSAVHGLLGTDRNYVVIYSINGLNKVNWTAVGSTGEAQGFTNTGNFNGLFITNAYLSNSYVPASPSNVQVATNTEPTTTVCTIQGLTGQGLFNNIENVYFADIVFGGFGNETVGLTSSGPLGVNVIGETTVNNISYADKTKIYGENISALFGKIGGKKDEDNTYNPLVTINNLTTVNSNNTHAITLNGVNLNDYAGLIASEMASGTVSLYKDTDTTKKAEERTPDSTFYPFMKNVVTAGGLVGQMTGGTINGNSNTINQNLSDIGNVEYSLTNYGGIIGEMSGGEVNGLTVNYLNSNIMYANTSGSFVAKATGGTFKSCSIEGTKIKYSVNAEVKIGLVAGVIGDETNKDSLTVENFKNAITTIEIEGGATGENVGVGGLVGCQNGNLSLSYASETTTDLTLTASKISNVGGIIGYYQGGSIGVCKYTVKNEGTVETQDTANGLTITGASNVGGFIGNAATFPTVTTDTNKDKTDTNSGYFNFLNSGSLYATIKIDKNTTSNVGGLFGQLSAGNSTQTNAGTSSVMGKVVAQEEAKEPVNQEQQEGSGNTEGSGDTEGLGNTSTTPTLTGVASANTIQFGAIEKDVSNVGGVIGSLIVGNQQITLSGITSSATIEFTEAITTSKTVTGLGGVIGSISGGDNSSVEINGITTNGQQIQVGQPNYTIKNFGGLIGETEVGLTLTGSQNSASISTGSTTIESGYINNSSNDNTDKPYAVLFNVGGLIGYAGGKETTITSSSNSGSIFGYQNVGGLVGYADNTTTITGAITLGTAKVKVQEETGNTDNTPSINLDTEITDSSASGTITGVINVGGAVGYLGSTSTIQQVHANAKIYANANGGGLVGLADSGGLVGLADSGANITSCYVSKAQEVNASSLDTSTNTEKEYTITAVYYNYYYKNDDDTTDHVSYIPTSIGGLIGESKDANITNCIVNGVGITSADEGKETGENNSNSKGMISTISNYMVSVATSEGASNDLTSSSKIYELTNDNNKVIYNELISGFGGFVGTMGNTSKLDQNSYLQDVEIHAQLGINVGTYYGVCKVDTFNTPKLTSTSGTVYIDGGYNIGGVVGKVSGNNNLKFSNTDLTGSATISLQSNVSGMYVGGLFGEVQSKLVENLTITTADVKMQITTTDSYYIGGLVGKLTVSGNNTFNGTNTYKTDSDFINGDSAQNFGGLVGMLKCTGTSAKTYSVQGTHNYAFTINTIENQAYAEGSSTFEAYDLQDSVDLAAQAYYINLDSFNIVATANTNFYSVGAKNPLRSDGSGWAKEYTGFKQMQRCIPQSVDVGWDSIAVVYNAEHVSNVATILNSIKATEGEQKTDKEVQDEYVEEVKKLLNKDNIDVNYIIYTVYDAVTNRPLLYSPIGIAELVTDDDGKEITSLEDLQKYHLNKAKDDITYVGGKEEVALTWPWKDWAYYKYTPYYSSDIQRDDEGNIISGKITDVVKEISVNSTTYDIIKFDWSNGDLTFNKKINKLKDEGNGKDFYQFSAKLCHIVVGGNKYYLFKTIYANDTLNNLTVKFDNNTSQTFNNFNNGVPLTPTSGSVFDVCGIKYEFETQKQNESGAGIIIGIIVAIVVIVVLAILTWVTKGAIWSVIGKVLGKLAILAGKFALKHAVGTIALVISIAALVSSLNTQHTQGKEISSTVFFNTTMQNYGLLTNTSVTDLQFDSNGQWIGSMTDCITLTDVDGKEYIYNFYSNQRPSDYISSYYCVVDLGKVIEATDNQATLKGGDLTQGYSKLALNDGTIEPVETDNGKSKYLYKRKSDGADAYLKYVYYEGKYYSNNMAISIGMYETQELSDLKSQDLKEHEIYYDDSGVGYIAGTYSNGVYKFKKDDNNLVTKYYNDVENYDKEDENSTFKINGFEIKQNAYIDKSTEFYFYEGSGVDDGYQFIKGAYYTRGGNQNAVIGKDDNGVIKYAVKYASFKYSSTQPDGTEGIDYVKYTHYYNPQKDKDGNYKLNDDGKTYSSITDAKYTGDKYSISSQEVFFKFENSSTETEEDTSCLGTISNPKTSELSTGAITLKVYPYSLYNPYNETNKGKAPKDEYFYSYTQRDGASSFSVKAKVRYYYYDGGYKFGANLNQSTWTEDGRKEYNNSIYKDVTSFYKMDDGSYLDLTYTAYDINGNEHKLTYEQIFENADSCLETYYITDVTELKDIKDDKGNDITGKMKDLYKLKYQFVKDDNKLYELDPAYMFNTTTGKINKLYAIVSNIKNEAYIQNKYLINKDYGLYTLYRYNDSAGKPINLYYEKGKSVFKINTTEDKTNAEHYYVIPIRKGQRLPNGQTTHLIESCKVSLGGGYELNYTGNKNGKVTSGTFTIS